MKFITTLAFSLFAVSALAAQEFEPGKYTIDPSHSKVSFTVKHLVISTVEGRFNTFSGEVNLNKNLTKSTVNATIDVDSVSTGDAKRDDHLRTADFFDVAKYPKMTFKSRKVTGTPDNLTLVGDLTLHGVKKQVTLNGKMLGTVKGMMGETRTAFNFTGNINRKDFGLNWNKVVEAGPVVGDEVKIELDIQATKAEQPGKKS